MKPWSSTPPSGICVLVVDDDEVLLRSTRNMLQARGHSVLTATNLAEAMEQASIQLVHVAVLDWVLEKESAAEVCAALEQLPQPPIVIVATGQLGEEVMQRSYAIGACAHLRKPYNPDELDGLIRNLHRLRTESSIPPPSCSPFHVDDDLDQVSVDGTVQDFSSARVELIRFLNRHLDQVVSLEDVRLHLNAASRHSTQQFVHEVRKRLDKHRKLIKTVSGGLLVCSKSAKPKGAQE